MTIFKWQFIKKNSTGFNNVSKFLLFHIYMKLNMFRATHGPSSGAWTCTGSLWFFIRGRLFGRVVGGRCQAHTVPDNVHQLHIQTTFHVWKTRGCQCSFRFLMMGGLSPETCWASYKYGIIKMLIHCCILLEFSLWILLWCTDPRTWNCFTFLCYKDIFNSFFPFI